jgi:hypothetical protein
VIVPGRRLILFAYVGTALFTVVSVVEVIVMSWTRPIAVAMDLILFAIGCTMFLVSYAIAIGRSRTEEIGVASLYFFTNGVAPRGVQVRLLSAFAVQCVVAVTVASIRPFTTAAFSVLVPMFGLGVNGLWSARHGKFGPRVADRANTDTQSSGEMEQNAGHG